MKLHLVQNRIIDVPNFLNLFFKIWRQIYICEKIDDDACRRQNPHESEYSEGTPNPGGEMVPKINCFKDAYFK